MPSLEAPLLQGRTDSESYEQLLSPQGRAADIEEPKRADDLTYSQQVRPSPSGSCSASAAPSLPAVFPDKDRGLSGPMNTGVLGRHGER